MSFEHIPIYRSPDRKGGKDSKQKSEKENQQVVEQSQNTPKQPPKEQEKTQEKAPEKPLTEEEAEKIKKHFYDELKKVEDLPQETEIKKWRKINECLGLIDDWLPFGYLDGFEGLEKLMDILEESKPKTRISYPLIKENISRKIVLEMGFQYKLWEANNEEKINKINSFIEKWLKNKSSYYQRGENFKNYILKPPEKYLEQRAKKGYITGEPSKEELNQEPDKISQWFAQQIGEGLKLLGEKDRTLSQISQILAMQKIPYKGVIDQLTLNIENLNIRFNTNVEIRKIEEMTDEEKFKLFIDNKAKFGTLPSKPLKIEFWEKLLEEKAQDLELEEKETLIAILNLLENNVKDKKGKEQLEQLKNRISELANKEKTTTKPEVVKEALELVKKEEKKGKESIFKKMGGWQTIGGVAGFSLLMFLILIFFGEFWLLEKATGIEIGGGKGKK